MKRRIIAALTALVMVVTMIPASAFAAGPTEKEKVATAIEMIDLATNKDTSGEFSIDFTNEDLAAVEVALDAYNKVGPGHRGEVTNYAELQKVITAFKNYLVVAKSFNDSVAKLKAGSLTTDGSSKITSALESDKDLVTNILTAYNKLDNPTAVEKVTVGKITDIIKQETFKEINLDNLSDDLKAEFVYDATPDNKSDNVNAVYKSSDVALLNNIGLVHDVFGSTPSDNGSETIATLLENIKKIDGSKINEMTIDSGFTELENILKDEKYKYAYLSSNYNVFLAAASKSEVFKKDIKAINDAEKLLVNSEVTPNIDYTKAVDRTEVNPTESASVNADNYNVVKKAYDDAKKAYDDFHAKYPTSKKADTLKTNVEKVVTPEKATYGTLELVDLAKKNAAIIKELYAKVEKKETFTFDDKVKFATLEENDLLKRESGSTAFSHIDAYLSSDVATVKKHEVADQYVKVKAAMDADKITGKTLGLRYGKLINEKIAALPAPSQISMMDKAELQAIVDLFNEFAKVAKANNITNDFISAINANNLVIGDDSTNYGLKCDTTVYKATDVSHALATLEGTNKYLSVAVSEDTFDKFLNACSYLLDPKAPNNVKLNNAKEALGEAASAIDNSADPKVPDVKTLENDAKFKEAKDKVKSYNDAYALLNDKEKAFFDKENKIELEKLAKTNSELALFEAINDKVIIAKCVEIQEAIGKLILESEIGANPLVADIYKNNEPYIAKIKGLLEDSTVKYVFENLQVDKNYNGSEDLKYNVKNDRTGSEAPIINVYKKAVSEYDLHNFNPADSAAAAVVAKINALATIPNNATLAQVDSLIPALEAAQDAYNALTATQKVKVSNKQELIDYRKSINSEIAKNIAKEMHRLYGVSATVELDANQKAIVANIDTLLSKYETVLTKTNYDSSKTKVEDRFIVDGVFKTTSLVSDADLKLYTDAKASLAKFENAASELAISKVYDSIVKALVEESGAFVRVVDINNYSVAKTVMDSIASYNSLGDAAKKYLEETTSFTVTTKSTSGATMKPIAKTVLEKLVAAESKAKAFFLENAVVESIPEQKLVEEGTEVRPVVVVKDSLGNVIDAKNYKVTYDNNKAVGTAKVIIDAVGTVYTGRVEATFEIVAGDVKLVTPENVSFHTDYGLLKITTDKIEGLSYRFAVREEGTKSWIYVNTPDNSTIVTLDNNGNRLKKNTRYEVRVATVLDGERSDYFKAGIVYTNRGGNRSGNMFYSRVEKVASPSKGAVTITGRDVVYKTAPQKMDYKFAYRVKGTKSWKYTGWGNDNIKTIKGLKSGKTYEVTVAYRYKSAVDNVTYVYSKYATAKSVKVK